MNGLTEVIIGIVGVVLTVGSIALAAYAIPRRRISTYLLSFESTVEVTDLVKDQVEIKYNKKKVKSLERVKLILQNTGNRSIRRENILDPITLVFSESGQVVEIKKRESNFGSYSAVIKNRNEVEITFDLMNSKDLIALELMTSGAALSPLKLKGRGDELVIKKGTDLRTSSWRNMTPLLVLINITLLLSAFWVYMLGRRIGFQTVMKETLESLHRSKEYTEEITFELQQHTQEGTKLEQIYRDIFKDYFFHRKEEILKEIEQLEKETLIQVVRGMTASNRILYPSLIPIIGGILLTIWLYYRKRFKRRRFERYFTKESV